MVKRHVSIRYYENYLYTQEVWCEKNLYTQEVYSLYSRGTDTAHKLIVTEECTSKAECRQIYAPNMSRYNSSTYLWPIDCSTSESHTFVRSMVSDILRVIL